MKSWGGILLTLGLLAGCQPAAPPEVDIEPPMVLRFRPQGEAIDPAAVVVVQFSAPVQSDAFVEPLVVVIEESLVDGDFLDDFDRPPLAAKRADGPVACDIEVDMQGGRLTLLPRTSLSPDTAYLVAVSAAVRDLSGNPLVAEVEVDERGRAVGAQTHAIHRFRTGRAAGPADDPVDDDPADDPPAAAARVVFSEILANPAGEESQGEYVELVNLGPAAVDLGGWLLTDSGLAGEGDPLSACDGGADAVLPADGVAVVGGQDLRPPPEMPAAARLLCTDRASLTSRGLRNGGGEILVLSDGAGVEVDRYGGWVNLSEREGCSAVRLDLEAPDGPDNWAPLPAEPCRSPGWVE